MTEPRIPEPGAPHPPPEPLLGPAEGRTRGATPSPDPKSGVPDFGIGDEQLGSIRVAGRRLATLTGYSAALMWALLGVLTAATGAVPPFQLAAMAFAVGAAVGLVWVAA